MSTTTELQVDDHFNAVSDKLQLSLLAAGCDYDTIASTVGTFKANVNNYRTSLTARNAENSNQSALGYIDVEAKKLGVQVPDYNYSYNVATQYLETGAETAKDVLVRDQYGLVDYDTMQLDLLRANPSSTQTQVLNAVLLQAQQKLNSTLNFVNDGSFVNKLSAYNANGHYKTGDILSQDDMNSLLSFTYSTTYGYDYASNFNQLQSIDATEPGEYDPSVLDSLVCTKTLSGFNGAYATFEPGEILPGYQLKVRILNEDYMTDSHKCNITFQFGISSSNDPSNII
jgi:hypothetical protein